jgi:porin
MVVGKSWNVDGTCSMLLKIQKSYFEASFLRNASIVIMALVVVQETTLNATLIASEVQPSPEASLFDEPLLERSKMTGDWLGARSLIRESGFSWDIHNTNFYSGVASGGLEQTFQYRGRNDILLNINGEKVGLWQGSSIDLHAESVFGTNINQSAGTLVPIILAESVPIPDGSVTALTGVMFTQALSENFLIFGGKQNTLDGFGQPFTGGATGQDGFMNTNLLFSPVLTRTFPYSTFAAGCVVLNSNEEWLFNFTAYDTNDTPTVSGFDTFFNNGVSLVGGANLPTNFFDLPGHQTLFVTYSTGKYLDLEASAYFDPGVGLILPTSRTRGSQSIVYGFDQAVFVSPEAPQRSWGLFGNLGLADTNPSPFRWSANIGVGGASLIPRRERDTFGFGYFYLGVNDSLKQLAAVVEPLQDELGVEGFYNIAATPWCHITADLQAVTPSRQRADDLLLFSLRAKLDF